METSEFVINRLVKVDYIEQKYMKIPGNKEEEERKKRFLSSSSNEFTPNAKMADTRDSPTKDTLIPKNPGPVFSYKLRYIVGF